MIFILFPIISYAETNVEDWLDQEKTDDSTQTETPEQVDSTKSISGTSSLIGGIIKTIVLLGLILALIYLSLKFLNKKNRLFQHSNTLENLGGIPLGQNKSIQVIRIGEKMYLIGVGDNVQLLQEIDDVATRKELLDRASQKQTYTPAKLLERLKKQPNTEENNNFSKLFQEELTKMKQRRETIKQQHDQGKDVNE